MRMQPTAARPPLHKPVGALDTGKTSMKTVYVVMETEYSIEDEREVISYQTPLRVCLSRQVADEIAAEENKHAKEQDRRRFTPVAWRYEYSVEESRMEPQP